MSRERETLKVAIGLGRQSIAMLTSAGFASDAARMEAALEEVVQANDWLRDEELAPLQACLVAGLPLS